MSGTTMTERLLAAIAHLVTLAGLLPTFLGMTLVPAGPIWIGGLAVNAAIAAVSWKRSYFVVRHAVLATIWLLAGFLPELLGVVFFMVAVALGVGFNMRNGTLETGVLAGVNPETLIRVALAPFFIAVPCYWVFRAMCGKECRVPFAGPASRGFPR